VAPGQGTRSKTVRWANEEVVRLGVDRYAKSRAIAALRRAGLIAVEATPGRAPVITLLVP
jgi:hypothetical protein